MSYSPTSFYGMAGVDPKRQTDFEGRFTEASEMLTEATEAAQAAKDHAAEAGGYLGTIQAEAASSTANINATATNAIAQVQTAEQNATTTVNTSVTSATTTIQNARDAAITAVAASTTAAQNAQGAAEIAAGNAGAAEGAARTHAQNAADARQAAEAARDTAQEAAYDALAGLPAKLDKTGDGSDVVVRGRTLEAHFTDIINVRDAPYNAKGDGSADDTAALMSAIATANAEGWKRHVYLPRGNGYRITSALTLTAHNSRLVGEPNMGSGIILDSADPNMAAVRIGYQSEQINGVLIKDITFARVQAGSNSAAIDCQVTGDSIFQNIRIYADNKFAYGFSFDRGSFHKLIETRAERCTVAGYKLRGAEGYKLIDTLFHHAHATECVTGVDVGDYVEGVFWSILYLFANTRAMKLYGTTYLSGPQVIKGSLLELDTGTTGIDAHNCGNIQIGDMWISNVTNGVKLGRVDRAHFRIGIGYTNDGGTLVEVGNGTDSANNITIPSINGAGGSLGIRIRTGSNVVQIGTHQLTNYTTAGIQIDSGTSGIVIAPGVYSGNTDDITGIANAAGSLIHQRDRSGRLMVNGYAAFGGVGGSWSAAVNDDEMLVAYRGSGTANTTRALIRPEAGAVRLQAENLTGPNADWQIFPQGSGKSVLSGEVWAGSGSGVPSLIASAVASANRSVTVAASNGGAPSVTSSGGPLAVQGYDGNVNFGGVGGYFINYVSAWAANTVSNGSTVGLSAAGNATNINLQIGTKGGGDYRFFTGSSYAVHFQNVGTTIGQVRLFAPTAGWGGGMTTTAGDLNLSSASGGVRIDGAKLGFGLSPVTKPTVTGSLGGNAALTSLITGLASMGLITNSTTT